MDEDEMERGLDEFEQAVIDGFYELAKYILAFGVLTLVAIFVYLLTQ